MKDNGLNAWEINAEFWDKEMDDESNFFHCNIVRPNVENLLNIDSNDFILDIACGNGNFSQRIVENGATVLAFDYSSKMIELAKKRRKDILNKIEFKVCDATNYDELLQLKRDKPFTKAVANMAIMDISELDPLFKGVYKLLKNNGIFVFATHHPAFTYPNENYFKNSIHKGIAIDGQPVLQNYYHRSMGDIFNLAFKNGFILDGFSETPFQGENIPIIMTVRFRKNNEIQRN